MFTCNGNYQQRKKCNELQPLATFTANCFDLIEITLEVVFPYHSLFHMKFLYALPK